jgi:hypothetical protein
LPPVVVGKQGAMRIELLLEVVVVVTISKECDKA